MPELALAQRYPQLGQIHARRLHEGLVEMSSMRRKAP
jgi:hypothetical protein